MNLPEVLTIAHIMHYIGGQILVQKFTKFDSPRETIPTR